MTRPGRPETNLAPIAELLAELDEFLREDTITDLLTRHLARRGHHQPHFDARNLIDQVSFTAAHLRSIDSHNTTDSAPSHATVLTDHDEPPQPAEQTRLDSHPLRGNACSRTGEPT